MTVIVATPAGMQTPEGAQRVDEALKTQEAAITHAANKLGELLTAFNYQPGKDEVIAVINRYYGDEEGGAESLGAQLIAECEAALRARTTANENFLRAIAGQPPLQRELTTW
jgi:hypothetical protein